MSILFIIHLFFYKSNKIINFIICNQSLRILTLVNMHFARDKSHKWMDAFQLIYNNNTTVK